MFGRSHLQTGRAVLVVSKLHYLLENRELPSRRGRFGFSEMARKAARYMKAEEEYWRSWWRSSDGCASYSRSWESGSRRSVVVLLVVRVTVDRK